MWDLVVKKVFHSRDMVFMEDKTIFDWESKKKIMDSGSINKNKLEDTCIHTFGNRMLASYRMTLDQPTGLVAKTEPTEEDPDTETKQDPEPDSDKEPDEELVLENPGRRYSLKERRIPRRFPEGVFNC